MDVAEETAKPPTDDWVAGKHLEIEVEQAAVGGREQEVGHQASDKVWVEMPDLSTGKHS